jgi:RND family efflux transporter MFP subunit
MKRTLMILLPIAVLIAGALGAVALIMARGEPEQKPPEIMPPLVRVVESRTEDVQLKVQSQGTVSPRTMISLVPEVSGRVVRVSPSLAAGGFFDEGEVLLELDSSDYEQTAVLARAQVAQAELRLAREEAEAEVARREWQDLRGDAEAPPLTSRKLQVAEARAALEAARAAQERAERDLERTRMRAPFAGRVREENVDVGQFVSRGQAVAQIYAVDRAEVRLPLPDEDLAYLDLRVDYRGETHRTRGPGVVLRASFAGDVHEWRGRIVRTEGEIDARTRMVNVIAQVDDPYDRSVPGRPPLAAGMFVEAEIDGRTFHDVVTLPRAALRGENLVWVVDDEDRIRLRDVSILRATTESVFIRSGLTDGERICISPLATVTDGMRVRTSGDVS